MHGSIAMPGKRFPASARQIHLPCRKMKAVNLGRDTDTVAAIAGGLAGILYGEASLPETWTAQLACSEMIDDLCKKAAEAWG